MGRNKQYIGSNLLVALVESDGKEREKRDKTKFPIYSRADSDLFFQRQQRWMRAEREPVKRSFQF